MSSVDADNLRKLVDETKGILREDIVEALDAAAAEIDRLQGVVERLHKRIRELRGPIRRAG
jgi:coenzyme F420-reducing hydrogenase delta subunit